MKEAQAQSAILDYLTLRGHFAIRINNQPIYDPVRKIFRKLPAHTPKGVADILVIRNPMMWIEVKGEKGTLSSDQRAFRDRCEAKGVGYLGRTLD